MYGIMLYWVICVNLENIMLSVGKYVLICFWGEKRCDKLFICGNMYVIDMEY